MKLAVAGLLAFIAVAHGGAIATYSSVPYGHVYGHGYGNGYAHSSGPITQYSSYPVHGYAHQATPVTYAAHGHAYNYHNDGQYDHSYDHQNYDNHHSYAAPFAYSTHSYHPTAYTHQVAAPVHVAHAPVHAYSHAPAAVAVHAAPLAYSSVVAPYAHSSHAVVAPVVHAKHSATYTAANKGSVHTAPLEGHVLDQTSLNLAPAPGTH